MLYSPARRPKVPDKHIQHVDDGPPLVPKDSRGHHNGTREMKCSYMNAVPGIDDNEVSCLPTEIVNER
jgi:hypothetical protein